MRFLLIASLFLFGMLTADQASYQTRFPIIKNYLDNFEEDLSSISDEVLIYTLPRTGGNLTIAILNQLTGKECLWSRLGIGWRRGILLNRAKVQTDLDAFPILSSHRQAGFHKLRKNKLISTLRNYKELFSRSGRLQYSKKSIQNYFRHLAFFDNWDSDKKFLVHYEDLIDNPSELITDLANFLNASDERVQELLENYDLFCQRVLASYIFHPGKTKSKGRSSDFHRKKITPEKLLDLENQVRKENPYLFEKYLKNSL